MKPRERFPSMEKLKEAFEYRDGKLYNKIVRNSRTKVGEMAGSYSSEYAVVTFEGVPWPIHRIIFFMFHGYVPDYIDHINGVKQDNRIENLREATPAQNSANQGINKLNKSGVKGVSWCNTYKIWRAYIRLNGKNKYIGRFNSLNDAKEFMELVRETIHGSFCNHGSFKEGSSCQ